MQIYGNNFYVLFFLRQRANKSGDIIGWIHSFFLWFALTMKSLATYAICCPIHSKQNVKNDLINLKKVTLTLPSGCLPPKIKIAFLSDIVTSVTAYSFSVRFFNSFIVNFFLQKWLKTHKLQVIRNKKSVIKIDIFKTILKILKNVKPTLKVEKNNCNRL